MASPKKLFIAVPAYGQVPFEFAHSLLRLAVQGAGVIQFGFKCHESLIPRARNSLSADFLASDCDKLLFIDSDLIFTRTMSCASRITTPRLLAESIFSNRKARHSVCQRICR